MPATRPRSTPAGWTALRAALAPVRGWHSSTRAAGSRSVRRSSTSRRSGRASAGPSSPRPRWAATPRSSPRSPGARGSPAWASTCSMPRTRSRSASTSDAPRGREDALTAPDVAVVGAGIVGAATARELAGRGARVLLLDRGEVSGGTTGLGEGNVLACDKPVGPELALTLVGLRVYEEIEARLGAEARIRRAGALVVHPDAATWAAEPDRVERLRAAGVEAEVLDAGAARRLEPRLTGELHGAARFPGDLQCDPRAIARALVREAGELGAGVRTGCRVEAIELRGGRVAGVRTPDGSLP